MRRFDRPQAEDEWAAAEAGRLRQRRAASRSSQPWASSDGPSARLRPPSPKFDYDETPSPAERFAWPLFLLTAVVLFELTANATLSVLAACLKFGWNDFRTALWLLRTDPEASRARACCWFYVASGVWKTAVVPILAVMVISTVWGLASARALPEGPGGAEHIWSALLVGLGASATLVLVVTAACTFALAAGVRVWVHPDLHESRRQDHWPPQWRRFAWQHENRGRAILATALIFVTLGFPPLAFRLVLLGFRGDLQVAAVLALVFGVPMAATATYAFLRGKIFAERPWQCWPESTPAVTDLADGAPDLDGLARDESVANGKVSAESA